MAVTFSPVRDPNSGKFAGVLCSDGRYIQQNAAGWPEFLVYQAANGDPVSTADGVPTARKPRPVLSILTDVQALTTPQATAVWADLTSGTPQKWQTTSSDPCVWAKASQPATLTLLEKQVAVAFYCRENVKYLVSPSFASGVNIPGDMPA